MDNVAQGKENLLLNLSLYNFLFFMYSGEQKAGVCVCLCNRTAGNSHVGEKIRPLSTKFGAGNWGRGRGEEGKWMVVILPFLEDCVTPPPHVLLVRRLTPALLGLRALLPGDRQPLASFGFGEAGPNQVVFAGRGIAKHRGP